MADETKKYIINIESNYEEYNKQLIEAKKNLEAAQRATEELKGGQIKSRDEIERANTQLRAAQKEYSTAKRNIDNVVQAQKAEKGSYNELYKSYTLAQAQLKSMGGAYEINSKGVRVLSQKYIEQKKVVDDAKISLDEFGKGVHDNRLNVGNYSEAIDGALGKLSGFAPATAGAAKGIMGMVKAALAFIATPIGAIIAGIVAVVTLLVNIFKTFDPLLDKIEQGIGAVVAAFTFLKEAVIGLLTGQKSLNETFDGMGKKMKEAAIAGADLKKSQQDLGDMNVKLTESSAKYKRQIDELLLQSKDRTKTEKERVDLIEQALVIEEKAYKEEKTIADKQRQIALDKIALGRDLTDEQKKQLDERGVEYALELQNIKAITAEEIQALADANANREEVLGKSIQIREKAINRENAILDKKEEADKKRAEKRVEEEEKANEKILKARKEMDKALSDLDDMTFANFDAVEKEQKNERDKKQQKKWEDEANALDLNAQNRKEILLSGLTGDYNLKLAQMQMDFDAEIKAANRIGADTLLIKQKYANYERILAYETEAAKLNVISGFAESLQGIFKENTLIAKAAAIAQASINTYLGASAAFTAMAGIPPAPLWGVIAATSATLAGIANVEKIVGVNPDSPTAPTAPTSISSSHVAQRTFAQTANPNILQTPQLNQNQLNALPTQVLTAADIGKEIAKLPPPIVTVEDINARAKELYKVEVRATI